MRSKEVEEAIKNCNLLLNGDIMLHILDDDGGTAYAGTVNKLYNKDLETALDYIEKLEKLPNKIRDKIEEYKKIIKQCINDEEHYHEIPLYEHDIKVLQELLEEEK